MLKNDKGSTIVMLLLIMAVLSIMGIGLLNTSINENRHAIKEHDFQQTFFIAKAGAAATADYMFHNYLSTSQLNSLLSKSSSDETDKPSTDFGGGTFKVSLSRNLTHDDQLVIRSTGTFNGLERTVKLALVKRHLFDSAIIALNEIYIDNPSNNDIYGDIATVGDPTEKITFKNMDFEDGVDNVLGDNNYHQINGNFPSVDMPMADSADPDAVALLPSVSITYGDGVYSKKDIGDFNLGSQTLTIDTDGYDDMFLIFDNLESNSGAIKVYGGGVLEIYVNNMDDFKGDIEIYDDSKVVVLANGPGEITYKTGSTNANLYIYAPEATVNISANYLVLGSIIAYDVNISSGADVEFSETAGEFPSNVTIDMYSYEILEWSE